MLSGNIHEWVARYLPLEIIATGTAIAGALIVHLFTDNAVIIAYAGTWSENAGYYGAASVREIVRIFAGNKEPGFRKICSAIRNIVFEFGIAEFFDSVLVRPGLMDAAPTLIGNLAIGILVGKILADAVFYAITIFFYELKKKHLS